MLMLRHIFGCSEKASSEILYVHTGTCAHTEVLSLYVGLHKEM